jgi:hypothetical protein
MLRTAGYTAPIRHAWKITNQANAFQNLMVTASVCLAGSDGTFESMGEAMFCNFDGTVMVEGGGRVDEIVTCEVRPDLVREARIHWGVENNPYQLWHRGYSAVMMTARKTDQGPAGSVAAPSKPGNSAFLITACTPQLPSTTCVMPKSTATEISEIASSSSSW